MRLRSQAGIGALVAIPGLLLLANAIVLVLIGVSPLVQTGIWLYCLLLTLSGAFWILPFRKAFPDPVALFIASFLVGMGKAYFLCFILYHRAICELLGFETLLVPSLLASSVLGVFAYRAVSSLRQEPLDQPIPRGALYISLGLALVLSVGAFYGYQNSWNQQRVVLPASYRQFHWTVSQGPWTLLRRRCSSTDSRAGHYDGGLERRRPMAQRRPVRI